MARWRLPVIIWFLRGSKNRYGNKRWPVTHQRRIPWASATLYGGTLFLAAAVLWKVPARPTAIPVSTYPALPSKPSWMDKRLASWKVYPTTFRSWLNQGIALLGLVMDPSDVQAHVNQLLATGLHTMTGVPLNNLPALLRLEIPALATVHPAKARPRSEPKPPRAKAQNEVDKSLPGDGGRVWAELGQDPVVGIYQTHSHESFWPYVPTGSATAYSTDWSKTIVQVGWWLAVDLHQTGIAVVQSRVNNMSEGLLASYNKSYYTAKRLLKWYPTVRMLIDLHRAPQNVPPALIQGNKVSKIAIVVGTNKLLPNEYWHQNLAFALKLSKVLEEVAPGILRGQGIETVPYRYNQQLMPADVMIEVGGPNSTLAEERYAVHDLAEAIGQLVHSDGLPKAQ